MSYESTASLTMRRSRTLLKRRNLEPATAALLSLVVRIAGARQVVEIGTANGFSALWLADAVGDTGGKVVSIDTAATDEARSNLARADAAQPGLAARVELRQEDGSAYLARPLPSSPRGYLTSGT